MNVKSFFMMSVAKRLYTLDGRRKGRKKMRERENGRKDKGREEERERTFAVTIDVQ